MNPPEHGPMPKPVIPMAATLSTLPPDDEAWGYEIKWDGVRALAYVEPERLRLFGRNLQEFGRQYPEVGDLSKQLGTRRAVLDGELVAFDDEGRPSFQRIQSRIHARAADVAHQQRATPVAYVIFDLLHLDGQSLLARDYADRRGELDRLGLGGLSWHVPAYRRGGGAELLAASRQRGLEGVVAKRLTSTYLPGKRTRDWLKVKNVRSQEMVIGGWVPGKGQLTGIFGALLTGYYDGRELRYAGKVGTGFGLDARRTLQQMLDALRTEESPFVGRQPQHDAVFVEPRLVCAVEFGEWTGAGTMRHPAYRGLRRDKSPEEVVREDPV